MSFVTDVFVLVGDSSDGLAEEVAPKVAAAITAFVDGIDDECPVISINRDGWCPTCPGPSNPAGPNSSTGTDSPSPTPAGRRRARRRHPHEGQIPHRVRGRVDGLSGRRRERYSNRRRQVHGRAADCPVGRREVGRDRRGARMTERCDVCNLPDLHHGYGDGIGSCDCPRCECGVALWSDLCTCAADDDEFWPEAVIQRSTA